LKDGPTFAFRLAMLATRILGFAACSILATTAVAAAQPALTAPAAAPSARTDAYLEPGAALGGDRTGIYGALQLDGGLRLDGPLWIHGRFAHGGMGEIEETTMSSDFTEARVGAEARGCALEGIACLVGGIDAAYRHERVITDDTHRNADTADLIARVGLDVGTRHFRLRPSIEAAFDRSGWSGLGMTGGIAYTW